MIENARDFTEHSANHLWQHLDSKRLSETAYMYLGDPQGGELTAMKRSDGGLMGLGTLKRDGVVGSVVVE